MLELDAATRAMTTFDPGPLTGFLDGFRRWLVEAEKTAAVVRQWVHASAHLGWWMRDRDLSVDALDRATLGSFSSHLSACDCPSSRPGKHPHTRRGVRALTQYLAAKGVLPRVFDDAHPKLKPKPELPVLQAFNSWMRRCRGVTDRTLVGYGYPIRELLAEIGDGPVTARAIRRVLLSRSERVSITHAKSAATAIRMFVRFLVAEGKCSSDLVDAVPKIARWRLDNLPRFMPSATLEKLLAQPETSCARGLRARAILLLLARLGLRAGDVAGLLISDVDWKRGRLQVSGKSNRQAWLPLCQEVGDALLAYLERGRPKSNDEHVFLTVRRPYRLLSSGAVSGIVRTCMQAAGVPPGGAHVLRHTAATDLLRQGLPLEAIGVVLRHRSVETTALYAKVDLEALRSVVQPWPGATPC